MPGPLISANLSELCNRISEILEQEGVEPTLPSGVALLSIGLKTLRHEFGVKRASALRLCAEIYDGNKNVRLVEGDVDPSVADAVRRHCEECGASYAVVRGSPVQICADCMISSVLGVIRRSDPSRPS